MGPDLCGCGCGEPVKPGNRYVFAHSLRTVRGLPYEARVPASPPVSAPCECGCGEEARPGNRYIDGHYSASLRGTTVRPCLRCGMTAPVCDDGTFRAHWDTRYGTVDRRRCPASGLPAPIRRPRPGRRVTLTVDVVLPEGWNAAQFQTEAAQALRNYLDEPFVVSVDVAEGEAS